MRTRPFILSLLLLIGLLNRYTMETTDLELPAEVHTKEESIELLEASEEVETETETLEEVTVLDPAEVELIGRTIWGEAEGVKSEAERAAVAWCILNRVDDTGKTIEEVVTAPKQFHGYRPEGECPQRHLDLAADVLTRWMAEKDGAEDVGRVLPADYLYFIGDGERNHFSIKYQSTDFWDWSLTDPYIVKQAEETAKE